jgi:hypothetical protein
MSTSAVVVPSPETSLSRQRWAGRVAGWALVVLGVGHLLTVAATLAGEPDPATRRALDGLAAVRVGTPGPQPTLAELFDGYSVLMGLMVVAAGALMLALTRHAAQTPGLLRAGLALIGVTAAVGLVVSWLLMPLPPLIGLGVTLAACISGLVRPHR